MSAPSLAGSVTNGVWFPGAATPDRGRALPRAATDPKPRSPFVAIGYVYLHRWGVALFEQEFRRGACGATESAFSRPSSGMYTYIGRRSRTRTPSSGAARKEPHPHRRPFEKRKPTKVRMHTLHLSMKRLSDSKAFPSPHGLNSGFAWGLPK